MLTVCEIIADDHRLFCGDLGNEVNDEVLTKAFTRFTTFNMARVSFRYNHVTRRSYSLSQMFASNVRLRSDGVILPFMHCLRPFWLFSLLPFSQSGDLFRGRPLDSGLHCKASSRSVCRVSLIHSADPFPGEQLVVH